jgi:type IV pilus assembly protein PilB
LVLRAGDTVDEESIREQALKQGMQTLRGSGLELMKKGITTLEEVASVTIEDE